MANTKMMVLTMFLAVEGKPVFGDSLRHELVSPTASTGGRQGLGTGKKEEVEEEEAKKSFYFVLPSCPAPRAGAFLGSVSGVCLLHLRVCAFVEVSWDASQSAFSAV